MNNNPDFPAVQFRVARPTDQLAKVIEFYEQGLGLPRLYSFKNHDGYDGVMLGLPNSQYHLEFTSHRNGSPCRAPTKDNLLVLYIPDPEKIIEIQNRLAELGYLEVEPENRYWKGKSITIADPDGWRIVLFNGQLTL
ncbi:MAG: VOC family protein [Chroococcidiopsidaceae cyanobacterium CP_BM_ER_R8_30]|nr:VOC family protein [Chroococcidiopsidaceae cyanobacterium CP_BM_ER_R8_30]